MVSNVSLIDIKKAKIVVASVTTKYNVAGVSQVTVLRIGLHMYSI